MSDPFSVIVADPPWQYNNQSNRGAARRQYPTLPDLAIASLPVGDLGRRDTILILWATWPKLDIAIEVVRSWGFSYKTGFPWLKMTEPPSMALLGQLALKFRIGVGWWIRGVSEPVLIGVREESRPPVDPPFGIALDPDIGGLATVRFEHSKKPIEIQEYAERWPGPYLELFARARRPGWSAWGNEIERAERFRWEGLEQWRDRFGVA